VSSAEVGLFGAGAIGSRVAGLLPPSVAVTVADAQQVLPENLPTSLFDAADCFRPKAVVTAGRRRARGAIARALHGDVRFTVRPGLVRALDALVLALDNPAAVRDVVETVWGGAVTGPPLLVLTCGNQATRGGYQVRCFATGRDASCPVCLWGEAERRADRLASGASCGETAAPRASAEAAGAAADAGVRLLLRWLEGDRSLAGSRHQRDSVGPAYVIRMPSRPVPGCPVPHHPDEARVVELDGGIDDLTVGAVAERLIAEAGEDAAVLFGRRSIPMLGMECLRCRLVSPAPLRLLPAAASERGCSCSEPRRPLATRSQVGARELLAPDVAAITLRQLGSGPGEELLAVGGKGVVRLRTRFTWSEVV
jgi:hypothetical protein